MHRAAVRKPPPALPRASECNDSGRSAKAPTRAAARVSATTVGAVLKPPPALPRASECNDSGRNAKAPTRAAARE